MDPETTASPQPPQHVGNGHQVPPQGAQVPRAGTIFSPHQQHQTHQHQLLQTQQRQQLQMDAAAGGGSHTLHQDCSASLVSFLECGPAPMYLTPLAQSQMGVPASHPQPPRLPTSYHSNVQRWDQAWNPVEDISYCAIPGKMPVAANCSDITDHICIGNLVCASDLGMLQRCGVTHILTLTKRVLPDEVKMAMDCKQLVIEDTPHARIQDVWEESFRHIEAAKQAGGKVLIHCRAGVSRGGCCTMAYLMRHQGMSLRTAFEWVKQRRPIIHPNKGFMKQLRALHYSLGGTAEGDINVLELPYTLWERAEHLGLSDPIPNLELSLHMESLVSQKYEELHGRKNPYLTMDAGLGGKMMLHSVELYSIDDFEWIDALLVEHLYTNRPPNSNYSGRRSRKRMEQEAVLNQRMLRVQVQLQNIRKKDGNTTPEEKEAEHSLQREERDIELQQQQLRQEAELGL